jgi:hypothetical protein
MHDFNLEISTEFKAIRRSYINQINDISERLLVMDDDDERVFLMACFGELLNASNIALVKSLQSLKGKADVLDLVKNYHKEFYERIIHLEKEAEL